MKNDISRREFLGSLVAAAGLKLDKQKASPESQAQPKKAESFLIYEVETKYPSLIKGAGFFVLNVTQMPAILVEFFNLANAGQSEEFKDPQNLRDKLLKPAADSLAAYFARKSVKPTSVTFILDDGHGRLETGAEYGKAREAEYARTIQRELGGLLEAKGFNAQLLKFDHWDKNSSEDKKRQRLEFCVNEANRLMSLASPETKPGFFYISIHAQNYFKRDVQGHVVINAEPKYPRIFVPILEPGDDLGKTAERKFLARKKTSIELAEAVMDGFSKTYPGIESLAKKDQAPADRRKSKK